ncbi:MAG: SUMF1/EgtB/PvdO family nonheme iron enzyme [Acidobacteria bacterium]|nr:SUMF1/EgtB/PvdO family nonheme iron enzyme [Acidobacteriota bacterium]
MIAPSRSGQTVLALAFVAGLGVALGARQTPPAAPAAPPAAAAPDLGGFVEIPGGPFTMGAGPATSPGAFDNERWSAASAEGSVDVPAFYIARREVTVAEFAAFAQATGWKAEPRALAARADLPVTLVGWTDAVAYTRWLTASLAASPAAPTRLAQLLREGWRVTLPTEAQWEKAARGTDRRVYPWGNDLRHELATFEAAGPTPAGARACPDCAHGLTDMAGNVWEWTRSPYQPYPYDEADDRAGLDADALWVMRGGGFADPARLIRTTARGAAEPGARRPFIGFRVALVRR